MGQVGTWPPGEAARPRGPVIWPWSGFWAEHAHWAAGHFRNWALAETAPGRLMPWLPVAFGVGVIIYFAAAREPALWVTVALSLGCAAGTILLRARPIAFPIALALTAMAAGLCVATLKTVIIAHPVLITLRAMWRSPVLWKRARSANGRIALWCARSKLWANGSMRRPSACGSRCAGAPRRRSVRMSRSKTDNPWACGVRTGGCGFCGPPATTLPHANGSPPTATRVRPKTRPARGLQLRSNRMHREACRWRIGGARARAVRR